ncbi:MAG: SEL1-like repeat protein [Clostridia bacterium]|nr:SEL1-like repeat protein [Clostridia bacterium]
MNIQTITCPLCANKDVANFVKQDYKKAIYWFIKSAEQGNVKAKNNLKNMR